jgi:hypothetical protein
VSRQNCSLAWLFTKFRLSPRNFFGPRRHPTGGVPASLNQHGEHEELDEASGLLIQQVTLPYLFCTSHFFGSKEVKFGCIYV